MNRKITCVMIFCCLAPAVFGWALCPGAQAKDASLKDSRLHGGASGDESAADGLPPGVLLIDGEYTSAKDRAEMAFVPAGAFVMGNDSGHYNEKPGHMVWLPDYYIDIHEVTNDQFERFINASGHKAQGAWRRGYAPGEEEHPVRFVTWHDAAAYAKWAGKRLPTEAEWEKAARGLRNYIYPWGNDWNETFENPWPIFKAVNVHAFPERISPYGCFGMAGNVWEWVADWHDRFYYEGFDPNVMARNPSGPADGAPPLKRFQDAGTAAGNERSTLKVIRGGGNWAGFAKENSRTSKRMWGNPSYWLNDTGFRCAISKPSASKSDSESFGWKLKPGQ